MTATSKGSGRARARQRVLRVTGAGGGGPAPTGNLLWGPDFGESAGNDDITFTVPAPTVDLESVDLAGAVGTITGTVDLEAVDLAGAMGTVTASLTGTALGAPFWQSVTTVASTAAISAAVGITGNKPTGTVSGDLLLALVASSDLASPSTVWTPPAGWTEINTTEVTVAGGAVANIIATSFYKIAGASEPSTYNFKPDNAQDASTLEIHRVIGAHATTPLDANAEATLLASALDPDPSAPAVTTVASNCLVFAWLVHAHGVLNNTHTPPASHVELTDIESDNATTGLTQGSTTASRVFSTPGSQAAVEFDCTETVATDAVMQRISIAPGTVVLA